MIGSPKAAVAATWISVCLLFTGSLASAQSLPAPWANADIGAPSLAGRATTSSGRIVIDGAGVDIWDTRDQFHFVYQRLSGDFDIHARVDSLVQAHWWTKAGVMVRASLGAGAAHAFAMVSGESGTGFQRRRSENAESLHTPGPFVMAPYWVRLTRRGTTLTAYTSADGVAWEMVEGDKVTLPDAVYVGLAVSSHDTTARATATFSATTITPVAVPAGATSADIGNPAVKGSVDHTAGRYTIKAGGRDIWDTEDQFHFVYQPMSGDLDVSARVESLQYTDTWAKAGVMIRESLSAGSRHAFAAITPDQGYAFQRRLEPGGISDHTHAGDGQAPTWLRLVRRGTVIEAFRSSNGSSWTSMGTAVVAMADTVFVGLAVTSHHEGAATVSVIDNLKVTTGASSGNKAPAVALTSPTNGAQFQAGSAVSIAATANDTDGSVARVEFFVDGVSIGADTSAPYSTQTASIAAGTHSLTAVAYDNAGASAMSAAVSITVTAPTAPPAGFVNGDIGSPTIAGSATSNGGTFTVTGAGRDIWDAEDQFQFVYQQASGDLDVRARLRSLEYTDIWAKAGVMIRETLAAGSRHAFVAITPDRGYAFQRRTATGGASEGDSIDGALPGWIRLTRTGTQVQGFISADGTNWTSMGSATVALGTNVLVGLAVTSHNEAQATTAVFDDVAIAAVSTINRPPAVSITSPAAGASLAAGSPVTISATAADPDGTIKSVTFYANGTPLGTRTAAPYAVTTDPLLAGTYTLTASATDDKGANTMSAGVTITASSAPTSTAPKAITFTVSADHDTLVNNYLLEVFAANPIPGSATPVAQLNLGKPAPDANGDATVDCSAFFQALAPGNYQATVSAIGSGGTARGAAVAFTR